MNKTILKTTTAPLYTFSADCHDLGDRIDGLIEEVIASSLSTDALAQSLSGGLARGWHDPAILPSPRRAVARDAAFPWDRPERIPTWWC